MQGVPVLSFISNKNLYTLNRQSIPDLYAYISVCIIQFQSFYHQLTYFFFQDLSFTDDHCLYVFFPVKGGDFNPVNKKIRKHDQIPVVTTSRVCIKSCGLGKDGYNCYRHDISCTLIHIQIRFTAELTSIVGGPTTPAPDRIAYNVGVKLTNLAESFDAPEENTVDFKNLAATISDSFNGILSDVPGYYKVDVQKFVKYYSTFSVSLCLFDCVLTLPGTEQQ